MKCKLTLNLRDNGKYLVPFSATLHSRKSLFCSGIKQWNKIPYEIRKAATISCFSKIYKEHLLRTQGLEN